MELSAGTLLQGGEYEIVKKLGQGGFGITYLAMQKSLKRKVAIKEFFMKDYCKREEETKVTVPTIDNRELVDKFKDRFHREAQFTAGLTHTNIVTIYAIFEENDTVYYVMEYLAGGSLSDYAEGRALPENEAVGYVRQIAGALKLMHSENENHLDVKPGNIMLRDKETAVLIDFGLTKVFDDNGKPLTTSSNIGYTPRYAPTDQQKGIAEFSPTVDIYALGATLYRLTVGIEPPFTDDILQDGLPSLPKHLSTAVREAITASMQPRRKDRPQSIDDFINILSGKSVPNTCKDTEETKLSDDEETRLTGGGGPDNGGIGKPVPPKEPEPPRSILPPPPPPDPKRKDIWVWVFVAVVALIIGIVIFKNCEGSDDTSYAPPALEATEEATTESPAVSNGYGELNGHEWVDLGLSVKWATCNIGASNPSDYGDMLKWGVFEEFKHYAEVRYDIGGNPQYDVATATWGSRWRLPTMGELEELIDKCEWKWTAEGGHDGYRVTGPNGNSIFLPAAGWRNGSERYYYVGDRGYYWSSTPDGSNSVGAYYLYFNLFNRVVDWNYRSYDMSVRPVCE